MNLISKYASQVGMPHVIDKNYNPDSRQRPGDIAFTQWGRKVVNLSADWGKVKQGIECLEEAAKEKETKYQRMVNLDEFMFFGATTFGGLNEHAQSILLEIGRAYTTAAPSEEEALTRRWRAC